MYICVNEPSVRTDGKNSSLKTDLSNALHAERERGETH